MTWMIKFNNPFRYFNSSPEVIRLVVMLHVRFPLSFPMTVTGKAQKSEMRKAMEAALLFKIDGEV